MRKQLRTFFVIQGRSSHETAIAESYKRIGIHEADFVFLYTDFRTFGQIMGEYSSRNAFYSSFLNPLLDQNQTVLIPTFTYTSQGVFDVGKTRSRLGALNKDIVDFPQVQRSEHPIFSVAAIGPRSDIVLNVGKSAFGAQSIFERLHHRNAMFLHVGRPVAIGNTCVHYVEQACGASYRYHKAFPTTVCRGSLDFGKDYTAFVRRRDVPDHDFDFVYNISDESLHAGLEVFEVGQNANYTNISCYRYDRTIKFFTDAFYANPSVFIAKPYLEFS